MAGNTFGKSLKLTTFGESHGYGIGGILDGIPPGIMLDLNRIQHQLDRRKPGTSSFVTPRQENDLLHIASGLFDGKTLGTPLAFWILNQDQKSSDYDALRDVYRPGHGDFSYQMKYNIRDHRGGGRASARETAARVSAGAIAQQILEHLLPNPLSIHACVIQLGEHALNTSNNLDFSYAKTNPFGCPDPTVLPLWENYLNDIKAQGKSVGAILYVEATGMPAGLGEPVFDKLDADIAKALMSINAVKSVALGDRFDVTTIPVDHFTLDENKEKIRFETNHKGGILAGISTGAPITALVGFKPTSSTPTPRPVMTQNGDFKDLPITGRHDPCVALRALPIVEAMMALTLADHLLRWRGQCGDNFS